MLLQIAILILCILFFIAFLYEKGEKEKLNRRLKLNFNALDQANNISEAILRNIQAYILLIDKNFVVLKTNYYTLTNTIESLEKKKVGDLLRCNHAICSTNGGCGTHQLCTNCPIRHTIQKAFDNTTSFANLEATIEINDEQKITKLEAIISGTYFSIDGQPRMVLTIHDVTKFKEGYKNQ